LLLLVSSSSSLFWVKERAHRSNGRRLVSPLPLYTSSSDVLSLQISLHFSSLVSSSWCCSSYGSGILKSYKIIRPSSVTRGLLLRSCDHQCGLKPEERWPLLWSSLFCNLLVSLAGFTGYRYIFKRQGFATCADCHAHLQLYYQNYKDYTPIGTVVRLIPTTIAGILCNVVMATVVGHISMIWLVRKWLYPPRYVHNNTILNSYWYFFHRRRQSPFRSHQARRYVLGIWVSSSCHRGHWGGLHLRRWVSFHREGCKAA
jgi:hypothetical protein